MEYFLNELQETVKKMARTIAEERIVPVRAMLDEREEFPWDIMKDLADTDMFRVFIPEEYSGLGGGCLELCLVVEELSRACPGIAVSYAGSLLGSFDILKFGNEEQKQKYLPDIASGKRLAAFAVSEAEAVVELEAAAEPEAVVEPEVAAEPKGKTKTKAKAKPKSRPKSKEVSKAAEEEPEQ